MSKPNKALDSITDIVNDLLIYIEELEDHVKEVEEKNEELKKELYKLQPPTTNVWKE